MCEFVCLFLAHHVCLCAADMFGLELFGAQFPFPAVDVVSVLGGQLVILDGWDLVAKDGVQRRVVLI